MQERACSGRRSDDDGITFNGDVDCQSAIASKLAPTGFSFVGSNRWQGLSQSSLTVTVGHEVSAVADGDKAKAPIQRRTLGLVEGQEDEQRAAQSDAQQRQEREPRRTVFQIAEFAAALDVRTAEFVLRQG